MNRQISLRMGQGLCVAGVLFLLLSGCMDMMPPVEGSGGGDGSGNANVDSLIEREESIGPYRVGDPYTVNGIRYVPQEDFSYNETGGASLYGGRFAGRRTANGERFDPAALTAAHKTLPFSTMVQVTNLSNNRSVTVRINDRGPFIEGRIIDLSEAAARQIGMIDAGVGQVRVEVLADETRALITALGPSGYDRDAPTATQVASTDTATPGVTPVPTPTEGGGVETARGAGQVTTPAVIETTTTRGGRGYYVRTAAYDNRGDAEVMASRLGVYGNVSVDGEEGGYRIYIGPYTSQVDAQRAMGLAIGEGARNVGIIQR